MTKIYSVRRRMFHRISLSDRGSCPTAACRAPHAEGHRQQLLTNACDEAPDELLTALLLVY